MYFGNLIAVATNQTLAEYVARDRLSSADAVLLKSEIEDGGTGNV